ncbi:zinc finger protein ZAT1-like [Humulus lupulus]|uniref:zinc finger protein ZAT1-like n=1 Tax=Humulus lupulus TaxID=3486 RepID=UPI002B40B0D4|nr:zinc finger protein ZAT1-like [Humulus lupulus]
MECVHILPLAFSLVHTFIRTLLLLLQLLLLSNKSTNMKVCEICCKRFSNGKALGGHMRSHMAKLPLPLPPPLPIDDTISQSASSSYKTLQMSSDSETESDQSSYYEYVKKRKDTVMAATSGRRSKRRRLSAVGRCDDNDEVLSVEEAAMFLMDLSNDTWCRKKKESGEVQPMFKCGTCRKVFSSYQALGGHKANHKKIKKYNYEEEEEYKEEEEEEEEEKVKVSAENRALVPQALEPARKKTFQCSFCSKNFSSGQALGGHKKIHYSTNLPIITSTTTSRKFNLMIDLNKFPLEVE